MFGFFSKKSHYYEYEKIIDQFVSPNTSCEMLHIQNFTKDFGLLIDSAEEETKKFSDSKQAVLHMVTRIIINSFEDDSDESSVLIKVRRSYECDNLKVAIICMNVYQEITNIYIEKWSDENGNIFPEVEDKFQITRTINNIEKMIEKCRL